MENLANKRKYVIYIGIVFMPDENAAAQRAKAMCRLITECGYRPIVIGMRSGGTGNILADGKDYDGIRTYEIHYPVSVTEWIYCLFDISGFVQVVRSVGEKNIKAVISMDYFTPAMFRMIRYCRKRSIRYIVDTVDWFPRSEYAFPKNLIKDFDTCCRMRILNKKADYMIVISKYLAKFYTDIERKVQIPGIVEDVEMGSYVCEKGIRFVFSGRPGVKCEKEKLDWMIEIICELNKTCPGDRKIFLTVAGIDKSTLAKNRPDITSLQGFDEYIMCFGEISHKECLQLMAESDFAIIIRENTRLSNAGFPTKLGEAYACGIPVFVTPTSDICDYIPEGYGIVAEECTYDAVFRATKKILEISSEDINRMHETVRKYNPLSYINFKAELEQILS